MASVRRLWRLVKFMQRVGGVQGMKTLAKDSPKYLQLFRRLLADSRVPASAKAILLGAGVFAASPLNLPGFIPIIGALDDIGIVLMAWGYFAKQVPEDVMAEHYAALGLRPLPL